MENIYFIVKEIHCRGHDEPHRLTVAEYRQQQGNDRYDELNEKLRVHHSEKNTSGPTIGRPTDRSTQLFDMSSYDIDKIRNCIHSLGFVEIYDLSDQELSNLFDDKDELLRFTTRFLKQVLYGIMSVPMKPDAREKRHMRMRAKMMVNQELA